MMSQPSSNDFNLAQSIRQETQMHGSGNHLMQNTLGVSEATQLTQQVLPPHNETGQHSIGGSFDHNLGVMNMNEIGHEMMGDSEGMVDPAARGVHQQSARDTLEHVEYISHEPNGTREVQFYVSPTLGSQGEGFGVVHDGSGFIGHSVGQHASREVYINDQNP